MNEDRGVIRRQRVYRKLLLSLGMYRENGQDEDFNYVKNYRSVIENDLEQLIDASLQVYKSSAYLILGETGDLGKIFPARNSLSDAILLLHGEIRRQTEAGELKIGINERIFLPLIQLEQIIRTTRTKYGSGFSKAFRDMPDHEFIQTIVEEMEGLDFLRIDHVTEEAEIMPVAGKLTGKYPDRYLEQKGEGETINDDQQMDD